LGDGATGIMALGAHHSAVLFHESPMENEHDPSVDDLPIAIGYLWISIDRS